MLTLRPAVPTDVVTVLGFIRDLAAFERAPEAAVATADDILGHAFGEHPLVHIVIAEWDGHAVGFALYFFTFSTWQGRPGLYLEDLYVTPAQRGHGIGRSLLEHLAQVAVAAGCGRFQWQVLDWNVGARRLYDSLGAKALDEWITMRLEGDALRTLARVADAETGKGYNPRSVS